MGGGDGNRTRVQGFAGPCLSHSATPPQERASLAAVMPPRRGAERPQGSYCDSWPRRPSAVSRANPKPRFRADDGIRTRDPHLGKVMLYQLSHVRVPVRVHLGPDHRISPALRSELYPILAQPPTQSRDDGKNSASLTSAGHSVTSVYTGQGGARRAGRTRQPRHAKAPVIAGTGRDGSGRPALPGACLKRYPGPLRGPGPGRFWCAAWSAGWACPAAPVTAPDGAGRRSRPRR